MMYNNLPNKLKRKFVKDYKLPITVFREPYFSYFMDLYDPYYNTKELYDQFANYCSQFYSHEGVYQNFDNITQTVIDAVKETSAYQDFSNFDMNAYKTVKNVSKTSFYNGDSLTTYNYLSIDLKKANFQALKFFNPELVLNCESYEEFLEKAFGDEIHPHIKNSKQVRQVIFGNLNPKRQQTIQKYVMGRMVETLLEMGVTEDDLMVSSPDEIVVKDMDEVLNPDEILTKYPYDLEFHMDHFMLYRIHKDHNFFVKMYTDHNAPEDIDGIKPNIYEFKNVPAQNLAEVIKYLFNKEINEFDRTFYMDGRLAEFKEGLFEE